MAIIREERIGDCRLIQGDCLQVLPLLDPVDAVITSPPYDNLRNYGAEFSGVDCLEVISHVSRLLSAGSVCVWNVADATVNGSETGSSFRQALHAMDCGLRLHDTMIYQSDNVRFPEETRYFSGFEYMFVFSNGAPRVFNPIKDRPNKWAGTTIHGTDRQADGSLKQASGVGKEIRPHGMRFNIWKMNNKGFPGHPATMPYQMAHDHAVSWTNSGDTILDPFAGSGTTGVACLKTGRSFIGIEQEREYFDLMCNRLFDVGAQPDLFVDPPKAPTQEAMDL